MSAAHTSSPKVSVCIPAYQAEQYLQCVVKSTLAQDYPDFEVVVIDNNSSDATPVILAGFDDSRLRVIRNADTLPWSENWNLAVRECRGEFVKLVCADDLLKPGCLAAQAGVLDSMPDVALVSVKCDMIDDGDDVIVASRGLRGLAGRVPANTVVTRIVHSGMNPIGAPLASMFRRADFEHVGGFSTEFTFMADLHLWVRLLARGDFYGIPESHACFRVRGGSMSGLTSARAQFTNTVQFARWVAADPRWAVTRYDLVRGDIRIGDNTLRRIALFRLAAWRNSPRTVACAPVEDHTGQRETTTVSLSTVICAYTMRRWDDLCRAVDSALAQDIDDHDVIVVVDHCEIMKARASEKYADQPRVTIVENRHQRGLSGARNTGVGVARGAVVAFLDDDAFAEPGWARSLVRHYHDRRVAAVGGYAAPIWPQGHRPAWLPAEFDWVIGCSYTGQPAALSEVRNPLGCNMSVRRSVFGAVGGFRSEVGRIGSHPVGGEETELCIRIAANDPSARILLDPEARVRHRVSGDRVTLRYMRRRCYHEGVSKAVVTELAQNPGALSAERAYVTRVLPRGMVRESLSLSPDGFARAGVMIFGLSATAAGYLRTKAIRQLGGRRGSVAVGAS
ncbi:glycosyltransferase family 2 protein [Mycolicibacterium iranicum]|nr:glycosyltransferase [Mycolicibacterium iranicum]